MFTVEKDTRLTADLIKGAIEYNETFRDEYDENERYYKGEHDILTRQKPPTASNTRIVVNHSKYITDTNVGYLLGNPVDYKADDGVDIEDVLEEYREQSISDIDAEIAKDLSVFGRQYELVYADGSDVRSADIDVRNAICIYDDTVAHKKLFGIIYRKGDKKENYEQVDVYTDVDKFDCVHLGKIVVPEIGEAHGFGKIPLVEYKNNSERMGDFDQVKSLIDAYNILQSDRVNDKEQLVEAILVGYGVHIENDQMDDLLANRTLFDLPNKDEAQLEYLVKNLDESQVDILRKTLENDIHKISMTPNMADENFAGNSSGVAIRYKLLSFEQNIKHKERYFARGLMERFELYKNYLVANNTMKDLERYQVTPIFKRNLPQNDLETAQIVNLLRDLVDDETLLGEITFVEDAAKSIELNRKEELERYTQESPTFGYGRPTPNQEEEENE
jgi:SPP1 family phage portal protein